VNDKLYAGLLTTAGSPLLAEKLYSFLIIEGREVFLKHGYDINEAL
jgi:hypothetical protein